MNTLDEMRKFDLGEIIACPGVLGAIHRARRLGGGSYLTYLMRHAVCDWGEVSEHVRELNDAGVRSSGVLRSKYTLRDGTILLIVTQGDRSGTKLLLTDER